MTVRVRIPSKRHINLLSCEKLAQLAQLLFFSVIIQFESTHIACESSMSFNLLVISMP